MRQCGGGASSADAALRFLQLVHTGSPFGKLWWASLIRDQLMTEKYH